MRRFAASTYEDLQNRVSSLFDIDSFLLKYQDEEGDLVTVSSEWELEEALRCQGPVLKLNVEATDDRQSGDFILVERDCVVHVDQTGESSETTERPSNFLPSPLATELIPSSEATPMAISPTPVTRTPSPEIAQATQPSTEVSASPARESPASTHNGSKRTYAEACESKTPYLQGAQKSPTYIISVSNSGSNHRSRAKPHAVSSSPTTPYVQSSDSQKPYAKGKDGLEFTQTTKVSAPYAKGGKSTSAYARPAEDSHYVSQSHASKPFTQVK